MHKSALTFGLLASSLVMLLIIPFLNSNNSFSNTAMAQGDEKYGDSNKDNMDNKTGAQGIYGIQGPQGEQGLQGETGSAEIIAINSTNLYEIIGNISNSNVSHSIVVCNVGDVVFDGGFNVINATDTDYSVFVDEPQSGPNGINSQYWVRLIDFQEGDVVYQAKAFCLNNP
jgi:hypothetical protein